MLAPPLSFIHMTLHYELGPLLPSTSEFHVSGTPDAIHLRSLDPSIPEIVKCLDQINGPQYLSIQRLRSNHGFVFREFSQLQPLTFPLCEIIF
jgi:hypothetical protein